MEGLAIIKLVFHAKQTRLLNVYNTQSIFIISCTCTWLILKSYAKYKDPYLFPLFGFIAISVLFLMFLRWYFEFVFVKFLCGICYIYMLLYVYMHIFKWFVWVNFYCLQNYVTDLYNAKIKLTNVFIIWVVAMANYGEAIINIVMILHIQTTAFEDIRNAHWQATWIYIKQISWMVM